MILVYREWWISIEATRTCYFRLAVSGIGYQPTRSSDVLNLKTWKLCQVSSWFFASIETTKKIILFWVMSENTLGQSFCRISYIWIFWLVNLNTGGPLLHYICLIFIWRTFFALHLLAKKLFFLILTKMNSQSAIKNPVTKVFKVFNKSF